MSSSMQALHSEKLRHVIKTQRRVVAIVTAVGHTRHHLITRKYTDRADPQALIQLKIIEGGGVYGGILVQGSTEI